MKKSQLRQIIREEIKRILREDNPRCPPGSIVPRRRSHPSDPSRGEVFGYECKLCGGTWKVYQKPYHVGNCPCK